MARAVRVITPIAWGLFAMTNAALLVGAEGLSPWLSLPLWGLSLLALGWLLIRYNRTLAQWRAVALIWLVYCALRWLGTQLHAAELLFFVRANMATLVTLLFFDALLAGLFAIVALAIRRDVSVAYVVIFFALGAPLLLYLVRTAGGVRNFFLGQIPGSVSDHFSFAEPLLLSLQCMATLGFLTFLPHLIWLAIKELRGG